MGFEEGFGVWSMDIELKFGSMALNMKVIGKMIKQTVKALFICLNDRMYKGEWKNLKAVWIFHYQTCRILNRDFCMVQMNYQIRQMKI